MIELDITGIKLDLRQENGKTTVFDPVRRKWIILTPEEHVRQYMIQYLSGVMQYPLSLIAVEKMISVGGLNKRFDIVVYNRNHEPWMLIECKSPEVQIDERTLMQLLNYQSKMQCKYWMLTNGHQNFCADAQDKTNIFWLQSIPVYQL